MEQVGYRRRERTVPKREPRGVLARQGKRWRTLSFLASLALLFSSLGSLEASAVGRAQAADSGVFLKGSVRLGSSSGPGLANVRIRFGLAGKEKGVLAAVTNEKGFYASDFIPVTYGATAWVRAELEGYVFEPENYTFTHDGDKVATLAVDFIGQGPAPTPISGPVANIFAYPTKGEAPLTVNFSGKGSYDPAGGALSYAWDFGDGESGSGPSTVHTYAEVGTYVAVLKVTNEQGQTGTAPATIEATDPQLQPRYQVTDLGTLGGFEARPFAVNEAGQVVGFSITTSGEKHAFLWLPAPAYGLEAGIHDLGTLGGVESVAWAIDDRGDVAGYAFDAGGGKRPMVWRKAGMGDEFTLNGLGEATGLNGAGEVVGFTQSGTSGDHGFLRNYDQTDFTRAFRSRGRIYSVERRSDPGWTDSAAGVMMTSSGVQHAAFFFYLWEWSEDSTQDIHPYTGLTNDKGSFATDIDRDPTSFRDIVVGAAEVRDQVFHAYIWRSTPDVWDAIDLGTLGGVNSRAEGVNGLGQVVGVSDDVKGTSRAFLWEEGVILDLNALIPDNTAYLEGATEINDKGQIVAYGRCTALCPVRLPGEIPIHAYLLTPLESVPTPTPKPSETPTVTTPPTATLTPKPSETPTETPSPTPVEGGFTLRGTVHMVWDNGPGMADVPILFQVASYPAKEVVRTDANGDFESEFIPWPDHDETFRMYPVLEGYEFDPPEYAWRHYGGTYVVEQDFVAHRSPFFSDKNPTDDGYDWAWAEDYIRALYDLGYVAGCQTDPLLYCPGDSLTRAEAAVYVVRGVYGAQVIPLEPSSQIFEDVPLGSWSAKWVTALFEDGFTSGCSSSPLRFCPSEKNTRAEAAVFFLRMLKGAAYDGDAARPTAEEIANLPFEYEDVPLPSPKGEPPWEGEPWYSKWVYRALLDGVVGSCEDDANRGDLRFRPGSDLRRAEAACMMVKAKDMIAPAP